MVLCCISSLIGGVGALLVAALAWLWRWFTAARSPKQYIEAADSEYLRMSATDMAKAIRTGAISSHALVSQHIARIRHINPRVNAMVKDRFTQALEEAARKDEELRANPKGTFPPFHGVPCTIKECFEVKGMPNTSGLHTRKHICCNSDAPAVQRMKEAGFIVLGVTNTSELCMWWETNNTVYGRTRNPYDLARIVGGSSGGEGCVVSTCGSPLGLGSDIGGSIRMPAFFNGIFGHKPTACLVPNAGQHPLAENTAQRFLCTGPLARHAVDLFPLLSILAGPEATLKDPASVRWDRVRVFDATECVFGHPRLVPKVSNDLKAAHARAKDVLQQLGAHVEPLHIHSFRAAFDMWSACMNASGGTTFHQHLTAGGGIWYGLELVKSAWGMSPHTIPALVLALTEGVAGWSTRRRTRLVEKCARLKAKVLDILGEDGIMLLPSHPTVAPKHNVPLLRPLSFTYTAIVNVLELPSTQVPLGLNDEGLPLGVQIVAGPGCDHLSIAAAVALERQLGGWQPPSS